MHWTDQYVGLPYAKADCAELCARVAQEVFGHHVDIPTYRAHTGRDLVTMKNVMLDFVMPIDAPEEGAVVVLRHGVDQHLWHVGTWTVIKGEAWVLHAVRNAGMALLTRACDLKRFLLHVDGYYRWV